MPRNTSNSCAVIVFLFSCICQSTLIAGDAETDEAARVEIQTSSKINYAEESTIFPSEETKLSPWLCNASNVLDGDIEVISMSDGQKPWSGFKLESNKRFELKNTSELLATSISFRIKAVGNATLKNLQMMLIGINAEDKSGSTLGFYLGREAYEDLTDWTAISIPLKNFRRINQIKSITGFGFQFYNTPPNGSFLITDVKLGQVESLTKSTVFNIEHIDLAELKPSSDEFPSRGAGITIRGANFERDGKPVFLIGVEDAPTDFIWLYKLLDLDVIQLQDFSTGEQMNWKLDGNTMSVTWPQLIELEEAKIHRLIANGFAVHLNFWDGVPRNKEFKLHFFDALADNSHFYNWRLDDPLGKTIREEYLRGIMRTIGKYPVLFYELYNEVVYGDMSPAALATFQTEMEKKYGSIDAANNAWNTSFDSFPSIIPPRKTINCSGLKKNLEPQPVPVELLVEWQHFNERWFGQQLRSLTDDVKRDFKFDNSYVTYQSVMNLREGFSGFTNTHPKELAKAGDLICHEGGMNFYPQTIGDEKTSDIAKMVKSLMIWDYLDGLTPDRPVYLSECTIHSYGSSFDKAAVVIDLNGDWRFAPDSEGKGNSLGFSKPDFDDRSWETIKAPGVWGNQGFPECTNGWYRKSFSLPATDSLFLTGSELADYATIYFNGTLIYKTKVWNERFSLDVSSLLKPGENQIAICIANKYNIGGEIQGGIRGYLTLTNKEFFAAPKVSPEQMRSWIWSMATHGVSGVCMSYFYPQTLNKKIPPIYSPLSYEYTMLSAIPATKKEIENVSEVLLPRPRLTADIAIVYPFETGRAYLPETTEDLYSGPVANAMMSYYMASLFSQFNTGITTCDAILGGSANQYKAIVLPASTRIRNGVTERLEKYVADGGILVLGPNAMSIDDDFHKPILTPSWFGVKTGRPLTNSKKINGITSELRQFDSSYGVELKLNGAEAIACFEDGTPAITTYRHGKGMVCYFSCNLPYEQLKLMFTDVMKSVINRPIAITPLDGHPADFIEAHAIGSQNTFLLYCNNFGGGPRKLKVSWQFAPDGVYMLRDVKTGAIVEEIIDAKKLKSGFDINLPSQDPLVFILDRIGTQETRLAPLSQESKQFLSLWRQSPKGDKKVLFHSCDGHMVMEPICMLTGKKILEDEGFEFHYAMDIPKNGIIDEFYGKKHSSSLYDFDIYVFPRINLADEALNEVTEYVRNGGSVLLSGSINSQYFNWTANTIRCGRTFKAFGLGVSNENFRDAAATTLSPLLCDFSNISKGHPVTNGVSRIIIPGGTPITVTTAEQIVLVRSNQISVPADKPFIVAFEFGKGRVVAMGDMQWMSPEWLEQGDNAQLLLNIYDWLAHKETEARDKVKLRAASVCTFDIK